MESSSRAHLPDISNPSWLQGLPLAHFPNRLRQMPLEGEALGGEHYALYTVQLRIFAWSQGPCRYQTGSFVHSLPLDLSATRSYSLVIDRKQDRPADCSEVN